MGTRTFGCTRQKSHKKTFPGEDVSNFNQGRQEAVTGALCLADTLPPDKIPTHYGLGHVLRYWRKRSGLLCREVAKTIGVDESFEMRWERNDKPISDARLIQFADAVGCLSVTQMLSVDVAGAETCNVGEDVAWVKNNQRRRNGCLKD